MLAQSARFINAVASDPISGMYRLTIPLRAMIERGWATGNVHIGFAQSLNVAPQSTIVLQRHLTIDPRFIATARQHGCRLVHDLDDLLWHIPVDNPNHTAFTPALLAAMDAQLAAADAVIVSTEPLAAAARERGFAPIVRPNVLDRRDWAVLPRRAPRARLRVGWYGQQSVHSGDLALLSDVVRALVERVDFVFFGDVPPALADLTGRLESHAPTGLRLFPATLAALDLDILLSPLADNPFNACKSNLRLIQAGMLGYAAIASDVAAHRDLPVTLVPNVARAWIAAIEDRINEAAALRRDGDALQAAVHERFLVDTWADHYFATWTGKPAPVPALV